MLWDHPPRPKDEEEDKIDDRLEASNNQFIQFENEPPIILAEEPKAVPPKKTILGIMGDRVVSMSEIEKWFDYDYGERGREMAATMPSLEFLEANREKGILVPGFPVTIANMQEKYPQFHSKEMINDKQVSWREYFKNNKAICSDLVQRRWYFFNLSVINGLFCKSFDEQKKSLPLNQKIPKICELAYVFLICHLKFGAFLFLPSEDNRRSATEGGEKNFWFLRSSSLEIINGQRGCVQPMISLGYNVKDKYVYPNNSTLGNHQPSSRTSLLTHL